MPTASTTNTAASATDTAASAADTTATAAALLLLLLPLLLLLLICCLSGTSLPDWGPAGVQTLHWVLYLTQSHIILSTALEAGIILFISIIRKQKLREEICPKSQLLRGAWMSPDPSACILFILPSAVLWTVPRLMTQ